MLLDSGGGATASDTDNEGRTALFGLPDAECARLLIERRCDVDTRDSHLQTALFAAEGSVIPQLLLQAEAAVDTLDRKQQTPLFVAAARGDTAMVRVLIEAGANGTALDILGRTPLFGAMPQAPLEVVQMLVCEGWADPLAKDEKGNTALSVARRAKLAPKPGVMDYMSRMSKPLDNQPPRRGGSAPHATAYERPKHYRFAFVGPNGDQLEVGSAQYEEALLGLAEQCPWLGIELWPPQLTRSDAGID
jgi:ankyrin repeat protein